MLFAGSSISPGVVRRTDNRINREQLHSLWWRAIEVTGSPSLGLEVGNELQPAGLGLLGTVISNASTLHEAIGLTSRYYRLLTDQPLLHIAQDDRESTLTFLRLPDEEMDPERDRPLMEFALAGTLRLCQWLTINEQAQRGLITSVTLRHSAPADLRKYREIFRIEPRFDQPENSITLLEDFLNQPVAYSDPEMLAMLRQQAERAQEHMSPHESVAERTAAQIRKRLAGHMPTATQIAERLNMSRSTLQRRLSEEGTSFREISEGIRRDMALKLVGDPTQSLEETADLLGYSEPAAFYHAFRRWTGQSPGAYRRAR